MSNIVDKVFRDVCLDERIKDGIFRLEEEEHMNALRDYFTKNGLTKENVISLTNKMLEGKYPERQAYRVEDGILITWPTPQYKAKAMTKDPGKYSDKNPNPDSKKTTEPPSDEPSTEEKPLPPSPPGMSGGSGGNLPKSDAEEPKKEPTIFQGDKKLEVEPPRGSETPVTPPQPPTPPPAPRTPERVAAEKEVIKQILATDDTALTQIAPTLNELCKHQLNELCKKANEWGLNEAKIVLENLLKK